jgi:hypothetical protein
MRTFQPGHRLPTRRDHPTVRFVALLHSPPYGHRPAPRAPSSHQMRSVAHGASFVPGAASTQSNRDLLYADATRLGRLCTLQRQLLVRSASTAFRRLAGIARRAGV